MTSTPTLPPTDSGMWRRLIAKAHPDAGGDHEFFIWAGSVRELVCNGQAQTQPERSAQASYGTPTDEPARIPYPPGTNFREATTRALRYAESHPDTYRYLLGLLENCYPLAHMWREEERGASYKRLAAIGHQVRMSKQERIGWYRVAESIPLSDRHAGHILSRLKRAAA
jgi:hypothetical protein